MAPSSRSLGWLGITQEGSLSHHPIGTTRNPAPVRILRTLTDHDPPQSEDDDDSLTGMLGRAGAAALRPVRAVAHAGKDALNDEAERAIDGVLAGPLPEAVGRSLVENHVIERVVSSALETRRSGEAAATGGPSVDMDPGRAGRPARVRESRARADAQGDHSGRLTTELADQIVQSPAFKHTLSSVLSSPEVRHALERQTTGFAGDVGAALRRKSRGGDGGLESFMRKLFHRPRPDPQRAAYGGLVSRGLAFLVDLLIIHLIYLVGGGMIGLITFDLRDSQADVARGHARGNRRPVARRDLLRALLEHRGPDAGRADHASPRRPRRRGSCGLALDRPPRRGRALDHPLLRRHIPVLFDSRRRGLPDYMAETTIVNEPVPEFGAEPETEAVAAPS